MAGRSELLAGHRDRGADRAVGHGPLVSGRGLGQRSGLRVAFVDRRVVQPVEGLAQLLVAVAENAVHPQLVGQVVDGGDPARLDVEQHLHDVRQQEYRAPEVLHDVQHRLGARLGGPDYLEAPAVGHENLVGPVLAPVHPSLGQLVLGLDVQESGLGEELAEVHGSPLELRDALGERSGRGGGRGGLRHHRHLGSWGASSSEGGRYMRTTRGALCALSLA